MVRLTHLGLGGTSRASTRSAVWPGSTSRGC